VAGALAVENLARFTVSTAFIGVTGLTADGITVADHNEAQLKAAVLDRARRVVVPVDASKIGISDFALVAPLDVVDMVVTADAPPGLAELCARHGVELVDAVTR
jgi:DeoR family fructose operon transcriptional repressor